jgi:Na+-translocating ferredoxin:NAD+ oxidoreductase subunit B
MGITFGTVLAVASRKFRVFEDPRIDLVEEMLPGTNCGACGAPGCRAFSEELVSGTKQPSQCTVSSPDAVELVASLLGVQAGEIEKRIARLLCAGGSEEAGIQAYYEGLESCGAAAVVAGGNKGCAFGCLGLADCEVACSFSAITMNKNGLPVVQEDLCTACGDCVDACPKSLFMLLPVSHRLLVQCRSLLEGEPATDLCSVACTACGLCCSDAPEGTLKMVANLPLVDYSKNDLLEPQITSRCPTGAIRWVDGGQFRWSDLSAMPLGRVEGLGPEGERR